MVDIRNNIITIDMEGQKDIKYLETKGGHVVIPLYPDWTTDGTMFLVNEEIDLEDENKIKSQNDSCEKEPSVPKCIFTRC